MSVGAVCLKKKFGSQFAGVLLKMLLAPDNVNSPVPGYLHQPAGRVIGQLFERPGMHGPQFFFSSRRLHTIFDCDWSSDVCSSDLLRAVALRVPFRGPLDEVAPTGPLGRAARRRSEERRVGKECRSRWSPDH